MSQNGKDKLIVDEYLFSFTGKGKKAAHPNVRYWSCETKGPDCDGPGFHGPYFDREPLQGCH